MATHALLDACARRLRISVSSAMLEPFAINAPGLEPWLAGGEALKHKHVLQRGSRVFAEMPMTVLMVVSDQLAICILAIATPH